MQVDGHIISGEFYSSSQEFLLTGIKHLTTESAISEEDLSDLYDYLSAHIDEEGGQVVTLNDQILVRLGQDEIKQVLQDLDDIRRLF
ncbi:hypothetical protein [Tenuibacillus multivorans]|uniref:Uncharacterized protein n=1 Tax=Tenuibacillus multivorans TaxID=237069 RepID=A0A1H0AKB5_9BACI|nr:hypothetical protein [Tenuibacillus multivorans]GEL78179.1 hypothetical protein TMU01_24140 [Tenuibacillus multivorans]SDN33801.1 hypothetical protein SAMN05216498_1971 [Tenuibacillus multivorans]